MRHVGHGRGVDHVVQAAGAQQAEEASRHSDGRVANQAKPSSQTCVVVSPRPAWPAPVSSTAASAGCRPPARRPSRREGVLAARRAGRRAGLGDADAQRPELGQPALDGHLPLDVLRQGEAHDPGAEVAHHLRRQRRDELAPSGVTHRSRRGPPGRPPRREDKVLDRVRLRSPRAASPGAATARTRFLGGRRACARRRGRPGAAGALPPPPGRLRSPGPCGPFQQSCQTAIPDRQRAPRHRLTSNPQPAPVRRGLSPPLRGRKPTPQELPGIAVLGSSVGRTWVLRRISSPTASDSHCNRAVRRKTPIDSGLDHLRSVEWRLVSQL